VIVSPNRNLTSGGDGGDDGGDDNCIVIPMSDGTEIRIPVKNKDGEEPRQDEQRQSPRPHAPMTRRPAAPNVLVPPRPNLAMPAAPAAPNQPGSQPATNILPPDRELAARPALRHIMDGVVRHIDLSLTPDLSPYLTLAPLVTYQPNPPPQQQP